MTAVHQKVKNFLLKHNMHHETIAMEQEVARFLQEMEKGLKGDEPSSLLMLPSYIEVEKVIPTEERVIVVDAGGTNFRTAIVRFDHNYQAIIEDIDKKMMPGLEEEISSQDFFKVIAQRIAKFADKSSKIGFCFSYPAESLPNKDGKVLFFSKEIKAKEVEGKILGENILVALKEYNPNYQHKIVILNDTVTTLLMGVTITKRRYNGYIGFILGTGTNIAYEELNSKIPKLNRGQLENSHPNTRQIINVESGGFASLYRGDFDFELDETTLTKGQYGLEKMISGAYFGRLAIITCQHAIEENLFSATTCGLLLACLQQLKTTDVSRFLNNPNSSGHCFEDIVDKINFNDLEALYLLFDSLLERAAKLCAIKLSAVILKSGYGLYNSQPICITIDGSTFYGFNSLSDKIKRHMQGYLSGDNQRYFEFAAVQNASLLGTAIAGLTNIH